jgi:hypothetical protein
MASDHVKASKSLRVVEPLSPSPSLSKYLTTKTAAMKCNLSWTLTVLMVALPTIVRMSAAPPPPSRPMCGPKSPGGNGTCARSIDALTFTRREDRQVLRRRILRVWRYQSPVGRWKPTDAIAADCKVPYEKVSKDGTCGPAFGNLICGDREWGPCCSVYGRC